MKYLNNGPDSVHFLDLCHIESGVRSLLGDTKDLDAMVQPEVLSSHMELRHAAGKIAALVNDTTRTEPEKHAAAKKLADGVQDKLGRTHALITKRADQLRTEAFAAADEVLGPKSDRAGLHGEVRAWVREKARTPEGLVTIRKAIESEPAVREAMWHSPSILLGLPAEVHSNLRLAALDEHRPDLFEKLAKSSDLAVLSDKFAATLKRVGTSFYNPTIAGQAGKTRVEV